LDDRIIARFAEKAWFARLKPGGLARDATTIPAIHPGSARQFKFLSLVCLTSPAPGLRHRRRQVHLRKRIYRLPSIAGLSGFAKQGGLMDYSSSIDLVGQFRQAASYIDRILKGEKPGDLPVQAPDKHVLVINLKAARALSLTIPEPLLATADEVIQ
jgi:putative ABC transport system substrate-binding protein